MFITVDGVILGIGLVVLSFTTILSNIFDSVLVNIINYIFLTAIILEYDIICFIICYYIIY
jgi:hypothetical protein